MVGLADRRPPKDHDGVTDEFIEGPFVFKDDVGHGPQILIQQRDHFLGLMLLGKRRKTADVRKEHRDFLAVAPQLGLARVPDELVHNAL